MKMPRSEFKSLIKECMKELIAEGALNNVVIDAIKGISYQTPPQQHNMLVSQNPINPTISALANSVAKNPMEAKLYENIFADSAQTAMMQNNADPNLIAQQQMSQMNMGNAGFNGMQGYGQQPNPYFQPVNNHNFVPQQGYQQFQQPQHNPQYLQNSPVQGNNGGGNGFNRWAQLAFNSPIKNRPEADGGFGVAGPLGSGLGKFG